MSNLKSSYNKINDTKDQVLGLKLKMLKITAFILAIYALLIAGYANEYVGLILFVALSVSLLIPAFLSLAASLYLFYLEKVVMSKLSFATDTIDKVNGVKDHVKDKIQSAVPTASYGITKKLINNTLAKISDDEKEKAVKSTVNAVRDSVINKAKLFKKC